MVGDLTKYEKKTITFPNAEDSGEWGKGAIVPCSFTPKLIVFYGGELSTNGIITYGIFSFTIHSQDINSGVVVAKDSSSITRRYAMTYSASYVDGAFRYDSTEGVFYAARAASGIKWSPSRTYTFEIFG